MLRDYRWSLTFVLLLLAVYSTFVFLNKKTGHPHEPAAAATTAAAP